MKVLKMQIKQIKENMKILNLNTGYLNNKCAFIIHEWRGYTSTIKRITPYYSKIEMYNSEDRHFIIVYSANQNGLSVKEINKNIYESIEKNAYKNN